MGTIAVDLDGVLNLYDGWKGPEAFAEPRPGAREFLEEARTTYRVVIHTTRDPEAVTKWLEANGFPLYEVTSQKVPAVVYLDDRALPFQGSFDGVLEKIRAFRPFWEE